MPVRKTTTKTTEPMRAAVSNPTKKTISFTLPSNFPMPKSWTPVLMVLLLVMAFVIGMLYTKMQYLSGSNQQAAPSQGTQAAAPTVAAGPVNVAVGQLPALGNKNAKVKVIEFADFQCPFCKQWFSTVEPSIMNDYVKTGKIAFYWRDYPFLGQESTDSANAARCANEQGQFWNYHDYLYNHQGQENSGAFSKDNLKKFAADMGGLNTDQFNSCVDSNKYASDVANDLSDGQKAGVNGTPTVFINGVAVVGAQPYTAFKSAIDAALAK